MKKHNNSGKKSEPTSKRTKSPGAVQGDTKEVLAELEPLLAAIEEVSERIAEPVAVPG